MSRSKSQRKTRNKKAKARPGGDAHRDARGRVHLALHQDAATGETYLELTGRLFNQSWQDEIVAGTANTARGILGDEPGLANAVSLGRHAMDATSRIADGLLGRAPEGSVACRAGCDHCCHQSVGLTPPEALTIVAHLRETQSPPELARLAAHVAALHRRTRTLSANERFSPDHPCPFLAAGQCTVYEVRPLACRGMNSLDAEGCRSRLRDPDTRAAFLTSGRGGHSYMEPIRTFHAVSAGLQLALAEVYGLDMRPLELTAAMDLLLNGPAAGAEEWLGGQHPFAAAVQDDATTNAGLHELSGALPPVSKGARS